MPESIAEFKHESIQDRKSIVKYLKTLWEGIDNGRIAFHSEDDEIELISPGPDEPQASGRSPPRIARKSFCKSIGNPTKAKRSPAI